MSQSPFSIRIFVADGDPDGLRLAERSNWIGKAVLFPRSHLPRIKNRDEFKQTGGESLCQERLLEPHCLFRSHGRAAEQGTANITTIQRRQCLVFTHDQTRFSLALIGVTQKELKALTFWFSDMLANTMLKLGYPAELMERAVSSFSELSFDTQCSRPVQGTLRNMIWDLESFTWDSTQITDLAPYSTSASLCERPCSIKGMKMRSYWSSYQTYVRLCTDRISAGSRQSQIVTSLHRRTLNPRN